MISTRYLLSLLLPIALLSSLRAEKSLLMGQIEQPQSRTIRLFFQHGQLPLPDTYLYEAQLDADNRFFFVVDIEVLQAVELRYEGRDLPLELGPGWRVELAFKAKNPWESLQFKGEQAAWNAVQWRMRQQFGAGLEERVRLPPYFELSTAEFEQIRQLSPSRFEDWVKAEEQRRANFIWMYEALTDSQQRALLQRLHYRFLALRLVYPRYSRFKEMPPNYYDFLENKTIEVPDLLTAPGYRHFLEEYLYYIEETASLTERLNWIAEYWRGPVGDYKSTELLLRSIQQDGLPVHEAALTQFLAQKPLPYYEQALRQYLEQLQQIEGQQEAPDFCLEAPDSLCLKDLRGKVVYLSFWASWCAPCIDEMIKHKEKVEGLEGEELVFLYLSLDKNKADWETALQRFQPAGEHYWMGQSATEIQRAYQVSSVPLYFLIDQQGRFVPYSKKISDSAFEEKLQRLLEK